MGADGISAGAGIAAAAERGDSLAWLVPASHRIPSPGPSGGRCAMAGAGTPQREGRGASGSRGEGGRRCVERGWVPGGGSGRAGGAQPSCPLASAASCWRGGGGCGAEEPQPPVQLQPGGGKRGAWA